MKRIKKYKPKAWIGIDPGQNGAMALVSEDEAKVCDYVNHSPKHVADEMRIWVKDYSIKLAILEKVHSHPDQGVVSTFTFGANFGVWQGIIVSFEIPFMLVTSSKWQKQSFSKTDGNDTKERSLTAARRLFPHVDLKFKKHHNRADALHMANYARKIHT